MIFPFFTILKDIWEKRSPGGRKGEGGLDAFQGPIRFTRPTVRLVWGPVGCRSVHDGNAFDSIPEALSEEERLQILSSYGNRSSPVMGALFAGGILVSLTESFMVR